MIFHLAPLFAMFDEENVFSLFLPPCTMYDDGNVCIKLLLLMAFPLRKRVRNGSAAKVALRTDTESGRRPAQSSCLSNEKFFNDNDEQPRAVESSLDNESEKSSKVREWSSSMAHDNRIFEFIVQLVLTSLASRNYKFTIISATQLPDAANPVRHCSSSEVHLTSHEQNLSLPPPTQLPYNPHEREKAWK